jgi:hypothetical protein
MSTTLANIDLTSRLLSGDGWIIDMELLAPAAGGDTLGTIASIMRG